MPQKITSNGFIMQYKISLYMKISGNLFLITSLLWSFLKPNFVRDSAIYKLMLTIFNG